MGFRIVCSTAEKNVANKAFNNSDCWIMQGLFFGSNFPEIAINFVDKIFNFSNLQSEVSFFYFFLDQDIISFIVKNLEVFQYEF